ncbi:hypothetical protein, partial [Alcanivorax sp. HI0044]
MTRIILATLLMFWSCSALASDYAEATGGESRVSVVIIDDYRAVLELFEQLHYTDKSWVEGDRHVPRVYL